MKKLLLTLMVLAILIVPVSAQVTVNYEIGLERILPGDLVECRLTIHNPNSYPEELRSVVFWSDLVNPRIYSDLGPLAPKSDYSLPFTFRADKPGNYLVKVTVRTYNGAVVTYIPFTVVQDYPKLRLENPELIIGQKNVLKVSVGWYGNVTLRPLFNATPSETSGKSFEFIYYPEKRENLTFEVEFRNGNNLHVIKKSIEVSWVKEKGISFNITNNRNAYRNEVIAIDITATNLNDYRVENVVLKVGENIRKIPYLDPSQSWNVRLYIPAREEINVILSYRNQLGEEYTEKETLRLNIIDESTVQICSYEFDKDLLSGQICNFGSTEVKNVVVEFGGEKYFVGTIMPEDYEVFSIKTNKTKGTLEVSWKDLAGNIESVSLDIAGKKVEEIKVKSGNELLIVSAVIAAAVVAIAIIALRRR